MSTHLFNESAIGKLDERTAWVLGWFAADGCVSTTSGRSGVSISLSETDIDVISTIQKFFEHTGKLYWRPPTPMAGRFATDKSLVTLTMQSKKLVSEFARFEIYPRKSGKQPFPNAIIRAPEACVRGFIRGYFEGNGSIGITASGQPKVSFCGSSAMMRVVAEKLSAMCDIRTSKVRVHSQSKRVSELAWKCRPALKVADWMYSGPGPFCQRKRNKYISILGATNGRYVKDKWMGEKLDGCRPVKQITKDGVCVKVWPSIKSAAAAMRTKPSTIKRATDGVRLSAVGFQWQYKSHKIDRAELWQRPGIHVRDRHAVLSDL